MTIRSGATCQLQMCLDERRWWRESGTLAGPEARPPDTQPVLNLPFGLVYTTVRESATQGSLWLPQAAKAREVVLHFVEGRIVAINAASAGDWLAAMLDRHSGEPRRVSHIGIGLNPHLAQTVAN